MSRTLAGIPFLAVLVFLTACSNWKQPVDPAEFEVPAACPDFSGTYWYGGPEGAPDVCELTADHDVLPITGLMLPVFDTSDLGGGWVKVVTPSKVEVRQEGCRALHFSAGQSWLKPLSERPPGPPKQDSFESQWREWTLRLVPEIQGTEVQWDEDSLYFTTRYIAEGFGQGWGIERMRVWMERADDGSLWVEFRHEQGRSGRDFVSSRCKLPRVE